MGHDLASHGDLDTKLRARELEQHFVYDRCMRESGHDTSSTREVSAVVVLTHRAWRIQ